MSETVWNLPPSYTAAQLVYAVRHAKAHLGDLYQPPGYGSDRMTSRQFLQWFRRCLARKINRHSPPRGRKCAPDGFLSDWERSAKQTAWRVNTPRLIVWVSEVPLEFRGRLAHRLTKPEDF